MPSLLSSASEDLRSAIEAAGVPLKLRGGQTLFTQGDVGDAFYMIESGSIEISVYSIDGRKFALDVLRKGEVFGEIALFRGNRSATATALSDVALTQFLREDVMDTLRRDPNLALDFVDVLCERLRRMSEKLEEQAFLPTAARLASRLLYLDAKLGRDGQVPISQAELAEFVNATREGVSKALGAWRSRNWVELSRGSIRILDRRALGAIAAGQVL